MLTEQWRKKYEMKICKSQTFGQYYLVKSSRNRSIDFFSLCFVDWLLFGKTFYLEREIVQPNPLSIFVEKI